MFQGISSLLMLTKTMSVYNATQRYYVRVIERKKFTKLSKFKKQAQVVKYLNNGASSACV